MDIGLAAAMMAQASEGDDRRYKGYAMLSALPGAPVLGDRRTVKFRSGRLRWSVTPRSSDATARGASGSTPR
jgi:hypothetical protein